MTDKTNTARGQMRLARLIAGLSAEAPPPVTTADFAPKFPPYTGLRNEPAPGLPPFEQPGAMAANFMPPRGLPQQQPPQAAVPMTQHPTPAPEQIGMPMGGQGFAGVEPPPGTIPPAYDPNLDPRYLPEQWRGAFNWGQGQ